MTDEELIEQIARTVGQKIEGAAEDMDSVWYGAPLWAAYIEEARVILPFIHADREAVRAEQAAEIERLKSHLEDAKEIIQKQIKQAAELAKFKALAETLAGAGEALKEDMLLRARMKQARFKGDLVVEAGNGVWFHFNEALRQYKEARDAS